MLDVFNTARLGNLRAFVQAIILPRARRWQERGRALEFDHGKVELVDVQSDAGSSSPARTTAATTISLDPETYRTRDLERESAGRGEKIIWSENLKVEVLCTEGRAVCRWSFLRP